MAERNRSIRDLNQNELDHVIYNLMNAIGASTSFEKAGRAGAIMGSEVVKANLSLPQWPPPESTPTELAWLSEPLGNSHHGRLREYSVFWTLTADGFQVWIGRTPDNPSSGSAYLTNEEVVEAVAKTYGFYLSSAQRRGNRLTILRWWASRAALPVVLLLLIPTLLLVWLLATTEMTLTDLQLIDVSTIVAYVVAVTVGYIAWLAYGSIGPMVIYCLYLVVGSAFLSLKPGWETEAKALGIMAPFIVGFWVTWWKNQDLMWMTGRQILNGRFRSTLTLVATWSVVTATAYGAHTLLRFSIDEAFGKGDVLLGFMIVIAVIALGELLRREIKR